METASCNAYQPIWSDDKAKQVSPAPAEMVEPKDTNVSELTVPPQKGIDKDLLLKSALVGAGVFVVLKIIE